MPVFKHGLKMSGNKADHEDGQEEALDQFNIAPNLQADITLGLTILDEIMQVIQNLPDLFIIVLNVENDLFKRELVGNAPSL